MCERRQPPVTANSQETMQRKHIISLTSEKSDLITLRGSDFNRKAKKKIFFFLKTTFSVCPQPLEMVLWINNYLKIFMDLRIEIRNEDWRGCRTLADRSAMLCPPEDSKMGISLHRLLCFLSFPRPAFLSTVIFI